MKGILSSLIESTIRNPLSIWLDWAINKIRLEQTNKDLKLGYASKAIDSTFGHHVTLQEDVRIWKSHVEDFTYLSTGCRINMTSIGKFCSIGPNVLTGLGKHPTSQFVSTHPAFYSNNQSSHPSFVESTLFEEYQRTSIGNDVWIGANVILLDGISISDGAIIGAGSVVTKNVEPFAIVVGTPARIIRFRFNKDQISKILNDPWWHKDLNWLEQNKEIMKDISRYMEY